MAKTLYDAIIAYKKEVSTLDFRQLQTALVRYVVPGWGGPAPTGARMKSQEIDAGIVYLKQVKLLNIQEIKDVQERVFEQLKVSKSSRRNYRYQLSKFVNWARNKNLLPVSDSQQGQIENITHTLRLRSEPGQRRERSEDYWKRLGFDRKVGETICLSGEEITDSLRQQIKDYETYRLKTIRPATFKVELSRIKRYLGWIHRKKSIPLSELKLESIIPVVKLKYYEGDFLDSPDPFLQVTVAERKGQYEAEKVASQVVDQLEEYLKTGTKMNNVGAASSIERFVMLAKWLYRDETRTDFSDVPVVTKLKKLRQQYEVSMRQDSTSVPYALKSAEWLDLFKVLVPLKTEADTTQNSSGKGKKGRARTKTAIGRSIQKLLILSMFVAMPPRRNRVIAELEFGKTLKKGRVYHDRGFIPETLLEPSESSYWCIVLSSKDYKTGGIYGDQSWEINNISYGDGTFFYDYLNSWINTYRSSFSPNHNRLFVTVGRGNWGKPATIWTINTVIKNSTLKFLGRPITPKEIRKMFVSYILSRKDTNEADLEAVARAMAHSRHMQMKVYDQVTSEARLATGMELANRICQEAIEQVSKKPKPPVA